jgi:hypothetical protein
MLKFRKTPEEEARAQLAKQYETEVLIPVANGRFLLEEAETSFNERHRAVMVKIFGESGTPSAEIDEFEIG